MQNFSISLLPKFLMMQSVFLANKTCLNSWNVKLYWIWAHIRHVDRCIWVWYTEKKHMFFSIFIAISDLHIERTVVKKIRRNGFK